jgi:uncharacterized protein
VSEVISNFIRIPLPDGRHLSARLWRATDEAPVPAILEFRPYRGYDLFRPLEDQYLSAWAAHGYAVLAVDTAGSGQSTGRLDDEYLQTEIDDAIAAIDWSAGQAWCDGRVGLSGMSWSAFVALRVSARRPAALKALVLGGVSEDGWRTDIHNLGGAPYAARVDWAGVMLMFGALPPDPAEFGPGWKAEWLGRLAANRPWIAPWLAHPARDAYWAAKAVDPAEAAPDLPLLLYAGWADKYATSVLRIAAGWRGPVRTLIGPWEHTIPHLAQRRPRIDFVGEALRWWDHWLKDIPTGVLADPPLRAWIGAPDRQGLMETGRWAALNWPAGAAKGVKFELASPARLVTAPAPRRLGGDLRLAPTPQTPPALDVDRYEDAPGAVRLSTTGPGASTSLTDPMADDVEFCGSPILRCQVRCDRSSGLIVARLIDVDPEGQAVRMTTGALNLAFRGAWNAPSAPQSGEGIDVVAAFQATAWRLRRGHRLALLLSADGWPTLWPDPTGARIEIAATSLSLELPLADAAEGHAEPVFAPPGRIERVKPTGPQWIDPGEHALSPSGLAHAAAHDSPGVAYHLGATGTDYFSASRFELALSADSRQATAVKTSRTLFQRPDWSITVDTRLAVTSTATAFQITWSVRATHDGEVVHDYAGQAEVPRGN